MTHGRHGVKRKVKEFLILSHKKKKTGMGFVQFERGYINRYKYDRIHARKFFDRN